MQDVGERIRAVTPLLTVGGACVVGGGLLAAATAYSTTQQTAWATAYLVLVGGVAQIGLAGGLGWLTSLVDRRVVWAVVALWNIGNAAVVAGQLASIPASTFAGAAALLAALLGVVAQTRRAGVAPAHPLALWGFRGLVVLLAVSIPIGLVLAVVGH